MTWQTPALTAWLLAVMFAGLGYFGGQDMTLIPATRPASVLHRGLGAVVVSGDMGLVVGMGGHIAHDLAGDGIPVVGVNSLGVFRHRRTPADVVAIIGAAVRRALALPGIDHLVLVGQSFGADMLPTGLDGLPPALRARVRLVALVVPGRTITYRASPAELFSWGEPEFAGAPMARRLDWAPGLCIAGRDETNSLCPYLHQPAMRHVVLPGGHPLRRDSATVYRVLRTAIDAAVVIGARR